MGEVPFIDGQDALRLDCLLQTVENPSVQVTSLVVHTGHDSICYVGQQSLPGQFNSNNHPGNGGHTRWVHNATHYKPTYGTTRQMQPDSILNPRIPFDPPFCKKIRRQLHRTSKARPHHRCSNTPIQPLDPLRAVDLLEPVDGILVLVLGPDREEGRVGLKTGLHKKERRANGSTEDARGGAGEHIDQEGLAAVVVNESGNGGADGFVEAEAAAIEHSLVAVLFATSAYLAQCRVSSFPRYSGTSISSARATTWGTLTAAPNPAISPFNPSFLRITLTP